jgi:nicotinamide-nucleotide amidase
MRAAIIAVGSELLGPVRLDTNSLWLTSRLESTGIPVARKACVGDDREEILAELAAARGRASLIVFTGGLGPTADDLTKEAVAEFFGRRLVPDAALLETLRSRFARRGIVMPAINEKQAHAIEGARSLPNPRGSAPGVWLEEGGHVVVLLPGVPPEMKGMFEEEVLPELLRRSKGGRRFRRVLKIAAMGESAVEEKVQPVYRFWPDHRFTILASPGEVQLHLESGGEEAEAVDVLDRQTADFESVLPGRIFGRDEETLESAVGALLRKNGLTLAVAESCTGGGLASRLTEEPGSSDYFRGGVVAYSNDLKRDLLGVGRETLEKFGAVSGEVASEMAEGALERLGSDLALSTTGIAGPGGGSEDKPVGTVWLALSRRGAAPRTALLRLPGGRSIVRIWSVISALEMLRRELIGE